MVSAKKLLSMEWPEFQQVV